MCTLVSAWSIIIIILITVLYMFYGLIRSKNIWKMYNNPNHFLWFSSNLFSATFEFTVAFIVAQKCIWKRTLNDNRPLCNHSSSLSLSSSLLYNPSYSKTSQGNYIFSHLFWFLTVPFYLMIYKRLLDLTCCLLSLLLLLNKLLSPEWLFLRFCIFNHPNFKSLPTTLKKWQ